MRDKAVQLALEKSAKQILHDRKLEQNEKRYQQQLLDEAMDRTMRFEEADTKRKQAMDIVIENNRELDKLGYQRFTID